MAENVARKSFCQPVRLPTLSITSQVESKPLGTFLLAAKEVPKQQIRTGGGCVRASHAATAGCAASGHAPRAVRGSAAASVRAAVTHQAHMAVRPNPHGGPRPVVATEGDVGRVCECGLCYFVAFCFRPGHNTSPRVSTRVETGGRARACGVSFAGSLPRAPIRVSRHGSNI